MSSVFVPERAGTLTGTRTLTEGDLEVRQATRADTDAILRLLEASMGWAPDERHARFLHWKHWENPHGPSLAWVALDGDLVVGLRLFMRWRFTCGGRELLAARAVDTATHPAYQGQGIFTRLTHHALEELTQPSSERLTRPAPEAHTQLGPEEHMEHRLDKPADQRVELVFNTPNGRSLPGYLKLGWQPVGRLPVAVRPRSALSLARLTRARTPAGKWSLPTDAGVPASEVLADYEPVPEDQPWPERPHSEGDAVARSSGAGSDEHLRTLRTGEHLRWRYGFRPLHYRAMTVTGDPAEGLGIFRLRQRGAATEAAVCELLVPGRDTRAQRRLLTRIVRETGADHAVVLGSARAGHGTLPVPGRGPTLVHRAVAAASGQSAPSPPRAPGTHAGWDLSLGDIELF